MFWIALAAQFSAPVPQFMWLSNDDTPANDLLGQGFAQLRLRLTVAPNGKVVSCDAEHSSGNPRLDHYTCSLAQQRARFRPAQSADGASRYGVFRQSIVWTTGTAYPKAIGELMTTLSQRPKRVRLPAVVRVMFAVDETGKISGCGDEPPSFPGVKPNDPVLMQIACDRVLKDYGAAAVIDENGQPVPSIQNAQVIFTKR